MVHFVEFLPSKQHAGVNFIDVRCCSKDFCTLSFQKFSKSVKFVNAAINDGRLGFLNKSYGYLNPI